MSDEKMADAEAIVHVTVNFIEELHSRYMFHVLLLIFKYLDDESLNNAELICKAWKEAISDSHPSKLWNMLFQQKIASSPVFKRIHFNLDQDSSNQLCRRKLLSRNQCAIKALQKNWLLGDFAREFASHSIIDDQGIIGNEAFNCSFSKISDKFIAWYSNSKVTLWNRHTLKVEEVLHIDNQRDGLGIYYFVCTFYDDAFIYSHDLQISIRNLTTKKTRAYSVPCMENNVWIDRLYAMNGFLVAAIFKKETLDTDFYIWKITSQAEVEWENLEIIPNMQLKSYELFIDHRYMIVLYLYPTNECVVRHMSDFRIKENIDMMAVNLDSGVQKVVARKLKDLPTDRLSFRLHSGHIVIVIKQVSYTNDYIMRIKVKIWNIKAITDPDSDLTPISQPQFSIETSLDIGTGPMLAVEAIEADLFGLLFMTARRTLDWTHLFFQKLNFLPTCNSCRQIKKRLLRCGQCKSAKYCSKICQTADWNHHKDYCKRYGRYNFNGLI
ncbi:hypothetical protein DAPPUDRAFT_300343 [Daphnia pulex]|uniref:MYND-type domain-containing protein n=1 Tax=Daphnia pulex TaxID=6669 RepID=E9G5A8_DAPPU|nr:hypothetical protein DAPPUDRAFT_300343 [Daphnia pulex]|eukprot:EFX85665.1 hypothetical protein DAPPUDRAFT_300343 [Daphnia pulex]